MRLFAPAATATLGWGALAFGAEYPWAYWPLLVLCLALGLLALVAPTPLRRRPLLSRALIVSVSAVVAVGGLYLVPLPDTVVTAVSPQRLTHDFQQLYSAVMQLEDTAASVHSATGLSVMASRTALGFAFLVVLGVFFLGCVRAIGTVGAEGIARGVLVLGFLVALIGIIQSASPSSATVLGFWYPRKNSPPFAPFINENHFAGWMVMAVPLAIGYAFGGVLRGVRHVRVDWRSRVLWAASRDAGEFVLAGLAVLVMALSVVLCRSRSGVGCLVVILILFSVWAIRRQGRAGTRTFAPIYLAVVLATALAWGGIDALAGEFAATPLSMEGRLVIWRGTLAVVRDFPLVGTGLNTYGIAMLAYQDAMPEARWVEAHNDYLQLAAEGGVLLGLPAAMLLLTFVREVRRRFREGFDGTRAYWIRAGAVVGLTGIACQELVDFSLQMPGNAALFVVLAAIAVHPGRPRTRRSPGHTAGLRRPGVAIAGRDPAHGVP